jgi:DNA polymerase III sliding clamp (beta) subunit (PCNA family)
MGERVTETTATVAEPAAEPKPEPRFKLLPKAVGGLTRLAAKDSGRYAMNGVRVAFTDKGQFRAEATDGKVLGRVTGECADAREYPPLPALESAPNGATEGVIPAKALKEACKNVPKGSLVRSKPILGHLAVVLAPNEATLASTDLDGANAGLTRLVEGRFPPCDDVFPKQKDEVVRVRLNPKLLKELLDVAAAFSDPDGPKVELIVSGKGKDGYSLFPVLVRAKHAGQTFDGLIVPLA